MELSKVLMYNFFEIGKLGKITERDLKNEALYPCP